MIKIELTPLELTMIRVALLQRLDRLKDQPDCASSYELTRELLTGKLWEARKQVPTL